jgi:hypothetical protein
MTMFAHIQCRDVLDAEADPFAWARQNMRSAMATHSAAFDAEAARIRTATTADYARIDAAYTLEMARISLIGDVA